MHDFENKTFDIRDRVFNYALEAIKLYQCIVEEKTGSGRILGKQYLRSATSIGANIEEAQSGESKADFIHKFSIAQKEAKESLYWLKLLEKSSIVPKNRIMFLIQEIDEIIAIITSIIKNTKNNICIVIPYNNRSVSTGSWCNSPSTPRLSYRCSPRLRC